MILFKIRDLRQKTQYKIDDAYLNGYARVCGVSATAVYNSLCRHAEFNTQRSFPSQSLIAYQHAISTNTVKRALKKLAEYNIILTEQEKINGKFKNNVYTLLDKSEWKKIATVAHQRATVSRSPNPVAHFTATVKRATKDNKDLKDNKIFKDNKRRVPPLKNNINSEDERLAKLLYDLIKKENPDWYVKPNWNTWANDIRKIREIDNRTHEQIEWMINFTQRDDFWHKNILSPAKLREQFNRLVVEAKSKHKNKRKIGIAI